MIRSHILLATLSGLAVLTTGLVWAQSPTPPLYVGSKACATCHATATKAWSESHHAWAWKSPDTSSVLGNFNKSSFDHRGVTTKFSKRKGRYIVETDGPDGKRAQFEIHSTVGVEPLQQYLAETEPGRLQALDVAWNVKAKRWYHLYPDTKLKVGDGLHWTGPYKNWNARCAECHATGFTKNYDANTRRYASKQAEIGVGCEACHGPGQAHAAWAKDKNAYDASLWRGLTDKGFTVGFSASTPEKEIQQCASCHSRREPFGEGNPVPGTAFHDAYRLALLREGLYHPDGSIQDEVYVYGSFLQSKMYAKGVRCSDCHDPHAARLKADGNAICTQCHSPAGNPRFPSLSKANYDDPTHHFHQAGSAGAQCKSCHMIERNYMGIDGRRDHSFRIPRPDLSKETGAPNACTDCHGQRDAAWAAAKIKRRFPNSKHRRQHFSQVFAAARRNPRDELGRLFQIVETRDFPGIVRATALDLLLRVADARAAGRGAKLLSDADPLVRAAAVPLQRAAPPVDRVQRLIPLLSDEIRSVRLAAAREFLDAPIARLPAANETAMRKAMGEWRASLMAKADYPEVQMAIGGTALVMRKLPAAEAAFRETVRLDPQRTDAWSMIIRILAAMGKSEGARTALDSALAANPGDPRLQSLKQEFEASR